MKYLLALLLGVTAQASTIPIDIGLPRTLYGINFIASDGLAGTPVSGQTLSLDYQFNNLIFLRSNQRSFAVAIRAEITAPSYSGEYHGTLASGYFTGPSGNGPAFLYDLCSSGIFDPNVTELLFGLTYAFGSDYAGVYGGASHPATYFDGLHFDMQLPTMDGVEITGLEFQFQPQYGRSGENNWYVRSSVPEGGPGLVFMALGAALLLAFVARTA